MKKGQVYEGVVEKVHFPNKGVICVEDKKVIVKNAIEGQKLRFSVNKIRKGRGEGRVLEVLEKSPIELEQAVCIHFGSCGGCTYQNIPYEEQLKLKERQVKDLLDSVISDEYLFEGIKSSPKQFGYRNKMEFSFGDEIKDGPLALGMHKRGSFHDIVTVNECQIVDNDYNLILSCVLNYFKEKGVDFYHKMSHKGYLRHLLVRKGEQTSEILIDLVTTSQVKHDLKPLTNALLKLELTGKIVGILHTKNDSLADVVQSDETIILFGQDYFYEKLLGLKFKISPFSFFQTNSLGAEVLYDTAREYVGITKDKMIFDLYSGTGTIAQMLAPVAKKIVGVEIVEEAVEAAKINASLNNLNNCEFIAGDVLKVIDSIEDKPDLIVLDPPRDGIHPKALEKIIAYGVERLVYISCKPTSLVRDLEVLQERGYRVEKAVAVDMFAGTVHVETVVLLSRKKNVAKIEVEMEV
jgi:23S rRNA (uracil1939-C5)-methyltransferase